MQSSAHLSCEPANDALTLDDSARCTEMEKETQASTVQALLTALWAPLRCLDLLTSCSSTKARKRQAASMTAKRFAHDAYAQQTPVHAPWPLSSYAGSSCCLSGFCRVFDQTCSFSGFCAKIADSEQPDVLALPDLPFSALHLYSHHPRRPPASTRTL